MGEQIKIAFVGTCCSGKTTLVEEYRKRGRADLQVVGEVARDYFSQNTCIVDRLSFDVQGELQSLILKNEQAAHGCDAIKIICDRSVLDGPAYVRSRGDLNGSREMVERVRFWIPTYYKILLLNPGDVPYQTDSIRQESEQVRQSYHRAFMEMFEEAGIPYELLSGTLEQRVSRVDQLLGL